MKKYLLAAAALALGAPAHAALNCGAARIDVGDTRGSGVVSTYVAHDPGSWAIKHTLANGQVIDRSVQYVIADYSNANLMQWRGTLNRNPAMTMTGELMTLNATGQPTYNEWLYKNGQLIMHSVALCQFDKPAPYIQPPSASAPTPMAPSPAATPVLAAPRGEDSIGIATDGRRAVIKAYAGSFWANMLIDTGATELTITANLANDLVAKGEGSEAGTMDMILADGSKVTKRTIVINNFKLGNHALQSVRAVVNDDASADMLLPFPVLNQMGRFTIDTASNLLTFG